MRITSRIIVLAAILAVASCATSRASSPSVGEAGEAEETPSVSPTGVVDHDAPHVAVVRLELRDGEQVLTQGTMAVLLAAGDGRMTVKGSDDELEIRFRTSLRSEGYRIELGAGFGPDLEDLLENFGPETHDINVGETVSLPLRDDLQATATLVEVLTRREAEEREGQAG